MKNEKDISPITATNEQQDAKQPTSAAASKLARPRAFYETQDQTSIYEEYLFGGGTYAKGVTSQAWSDSTKGRMGIRLVSRGLFGAAAFAWGSRTASKQLLNYDPSKFSLRVAIKERKPLQILAHGFDKTVGAGISRIARTVAREGQKDEWAKSAVTFRNKGYFFSKAGNNNGRSLGAEMVAMTFDFASASVGDATARNVIQAFDPSLQKPWRDEDGNLDPKRFTKSVGKAAWRVFSKNQMEDWAAALPYVYQMKWQRQAMARYFPGFKLVSDSAWNGGSMKVNSAGQVTGDYQLPGLMDLQLRFAGYNWYTLMYRETYDAITRTFNNWKDNDYKIDPKLPDNPLESIAKTVISPIRYAAKSFVKAHIYMIPAVPFFWMWRTPQSKWKSGTILEKAVTADGAKKKQNAIASLNSRSEASLMPVRDPKTGGYDFKSATANSAGRYGIGADKAVAQGGIYTNPGFDGKFLWFGTQRVKNSADLGVGDAAYKWSNQKTLVGKMLNPFGWVSYKLGSAGTHLLDRIDPSNKFFKFMGGDLLRREVNFRTFMDASLAYTPYFIAKTELGLRVDDRGPGGTIGRMDKAIYGAIDNLATFNISGFQKSVGRMVDLIASPATEVPMKEGEAKTKSDVAKEKVIEKVLEKQAATPSNKIQSATSQLGIEARRNFKTQPDKPQGTPNWADGVKKDRNQKAAMLYPPHQTIQ